ncbi:short chain dehydrogenase domain-containing protein [Ditylenchus destructor]|uniref:Short chain dehydrogenase domain-containing protein n=1 Tax=Ditylenchus destructor TaxID=166010 RepID=A0AAD4R0E9_9BILA|nr:short chain dehydrogenase domain-containing protein [Ditylenchus destructor]
MWNRGFTFDILPYSKYLAHLIDELWTVIHVYWIGFYYSLYELIFENLASRSTLEYSWDPEQWQQKSSILKAARINDKSAEEKSENEVGCKQLVAVMTGADGTIGNEIVSMLNSLDIFVVALGLRRPPNLLRDSDNDDSASSSASESSIFICCDLLDLAQVSRAADQILAQIPSFDLLICNAGVMLISRKNSTQNPQLKVNVLAHVLLFNKLKESMARSKQESPRAIFVSSSTIHAGNPRKWLTYDWNNCEIDNNANAEENGYKAYADSKLLLSLYVKYLANNLRSSNSPIRVCSLHPGVVPGRLYANVFAPFRLFINGILSSILRPSRVAACHILGLLLDDRMLNGEYYENGRRVKIADQINALELERLGTAVDEKVLSFDS